MKFEVIILGSSSATPIFNRNPTSQLLNLNDNFFLIDCGEGTQQQMLRYNIKASRINHIFISHIHGDHYLGLVGLLSSLHLNGRTKPLMLFGPPELKEIIELQFRYSQTQLRYPLNFYATQALKPEIVFENNDVLVETIPLDHRIACTGYKFTQKKRLPKIIKQKVEEFAIPLQQIALIKRGFPFTDKLGEEHPASELTEAADEPKTYAYCSDTICSWAYLNQIENIDLLYHEATFMQDMLQRAQETFHTTARQAGEVALKAQVKRLLIGHFSARYRDLQPLLDECREVFPDTSLAIEGVVFDV